MCRAKDPPVIELCARRISATGKRCVQELHLNCECRSVNSATSPSRVESTVCARVCVSLTPSAHVTTQTRCSTRAVTTSSVWFELGACSVGWLRLREENRTLLLHSSKTSSICSLDCSCWSVLPCSGAVCIYPNLVRLSSGYRIGGPWALRAASNLHRRKWSLCGNAKLAERSMGN